METESAELLNFGDVDPPDPEMARASIIQAPLELSVSYGQGTALGPAAIINASAALELYDEVLQQETWRLGILTRPALSLQGNIEEMLQDIEQAVAAELKQRRLPVLLGGEHTVTLGALRALLKHRGNDFTVLSFDAHLDLRDEYLDNPLSHACVMKRALDMGLNVRHVAVRSCSAQEAAFVQDRGLNPLWAHQIHHNPDWLQVALEDLHGPVYISLDIDGLDPSAMPATGTPEPGGLNWTQLVDWLAAVCAKCPVAGLDLVELAPLSGQPAWDFTAAKLLYRAIGLALSGDSL